VCAVEWEAYPASVLCARQNDGLLETFPIWDDVCSFDGKPWRGIVDVVSGGFPCQDISSAGKGAGIDGEQSGMWREMARIIHEVQPQFVFVENSPMLTSRGLGRVLGDLASMGFDARWGVLGAADVGAKHQRDRIWIVAHAPPPDNWPTPATKGYGHAAEGMVGNLIEKIQQGVITKLEAEQMLSLPHLENHRTWKKKFPTPQASDHRDRGNMSNAVVQRRIAIGKQISLSQSVSLTSGQLNPMWVEWLMGFPRDWTNLSALVMPKSHCVPQQHGKYSVKESND
jgi:site-specific DNA-cytosine methylase